MHMKTKLLFIVVALFTNGVLYGQICYPTTPGTSTNGNVGIGVCGPGADYKLHIDANHGTTAALTHGQLTEIYTNSSTGSLRDFWGRVYATGGSTTLGTATNIFLDYYTSGGASITNANGVHVQASSSYNIVNSTGFRAEVNGTDQVKGFAATVNGTTSGMDKWGLQATVSGAGDYNYGSECNSTGASINYGLYGKGYGSTGTNYGVYGLAEGSGTTRYGVYGTATDGTSRYGLYGFGSGSSGESSKTWYGLYATVSAPGDANGSPASSNKAYAVYANATSYSPPAPGGLTGTNTNSYAGWFNGHVWVQGISASSSDARIKTEVNTLEGALDRILQLRSVSYQFDHAKHPSLNLPYGKQFGVLAQELEKVIPELVLNTQTADQYDQDGKLIESGFDLKGVNYQGLIPILLAGIQEQQAAIADKQAQLDAKQAQLDQLTDRLSKLEQAVASGSTSIDGSRRTDNAKLYQNEPNPASENTKIRYYVQNSSAKVSIEVRAQSGQVVKTFSGFRGDNGQVVVSAGSLETGTYSYTLIVDGERVDSKLMIITH